MGKTGGGASKEVGGGEGTSEAEDGLDKGLSESHRVPSCSRWSVEDQGTCSPWLTGSVGLWILYWFPTAAGTCYHDFDHLQYHRCKALEVRSLKQAQLGCREGISRTVFLLEVLGEHWGPPPFLLWFPDAARIP